MAKEQAEKLSERLFERSLLAVGEHEPPSPETIIRKRMIVSG